MSVLVWVMFDGQQQDMVALCRSGDGIWLAFRWDWRETNEMFGTGHATRRNAEEAVMDWTETMEAAGSWIIAGPMELPVGGPEHSDELIVDAWWKSQLHPTVMNMVLHNPEDDFECTLSLPPATGIHAAWEAVAKHPSPYREKLAWGP